MYVQVKSLNLQQRPFQKDVFSSTWLFMCIKNFFREIAKILLPPKPKELIRLSFQLTYSYNRQKARITYNGQRSTLKQKKKLKEKIQIYVFNKCILNPAKFSNRILNIGAKFTMGVLFFLAWQRATGTKINGIPHIFLTWVGLFGDLHGKTQMSILCI